EEARLELPDPVVAFQGGARGLARGALFEGALGEPALVEATELRRPSPQGPGQRQRRGKPVEEESEPLHELQCLLRLTLDLVEGMAQGEKDGGETARGDGGIRRVAVLLRHLEGTARRIDGFPERSRPGDPGREAEIGPPPEARPSATFEQS